MKNSALACLVSACISAASAAAQEFPEVMFITDSSGSMQELAGAQSKMNAAKTVLADVISKLPQEVKIGLSAYGHRNQRDCKDVEILVPAGTADRANISSKIASMQPMGMTPIALALTTVAEAIKERKAETTIVLVSDGKETCGGDPCGVVKQLIAQGYRLIVHVVGFGVNEDEKKQLLCIAEAGKGKYFAAGDAASLLAALESVRGELVQKVEKAKTTTVAAKTGLGKLQLRVPQDSAASLAGIKIARVSDGKTVKEGELSGADSTHPLMSGEYELTLMFANPNYKDPTPAVLRKFTVGGGETALVELGAIAFNMADELKKMPVSSVIIRKSADGAEILKLEKHGNDYYLYKPKPVAPGAYDVLFEYYRCEQPTVIASNLEVPAGRMAFVTLDAAFSLKEPSASGLQGWDLIPAGAKQPAIAARRGSDNSEPLYRIFAVPPGKYDFTIHMKGMDEPLPVGAGIEIKQGETLVFDSGL